MSIETLLEAAKFVEWSAQIGYGARANDDEPDVQTVGKNGQSGSAKAGASATGVSSSPGSSPGSSSPVVSSGKHNEETEGDDKRSGTREVHNKLEKNRRAHLKECFDNLRETIPNMDDKKMKPSNLSILQGALRYLQALKRKERDLEYETEKLARQKIQYQDKLVKLKGVYSHWKVEKSLKVEEKDDQRDEDMDTDGEDCDSVSTSTSTASEAEEEERKSRAQSPELKYSQIVRKTDMADQKVEPPLVRTDQSSDHVIKSGPFVISRRIVTHVPITTAAGQQQVPAHIPIVVKQHSQQGLTEKKVGTQPKTMTLPPAQFQPKTIIVAPAQFQQQPRGITGIRQPLTTAKEYASPQEATRVAPPQLTRRQVVTQFMVRPQIRRATSQKMVTTTEKLVVTTQSTALQPVIIHETTAQSQAPSLTYATAQPVITPQTTAKHIVAPLTSDQTQQQIKVTSQTISSVNSKVTSHQGIRHSTAVSAVQEHLKNKAQSKQFNQQQKESNTISHTTPTMEPLTSKLNVTIVTTTAVATVTTSGGVARQTVSQLLGKQQAMVVRQPVRRTDNKFVVQRVTRHPFSPRSQTVDIMPKSSKLVTISSDTSVTQVSYTLSKPVNVVTSKEPQTVHVTSAMPSTMAVTSSGTVANVTNAIPTCSVALQHATPPPGLDVRSFIAGHNTMLPSFQHYLPQGGLGAAMMRPNLPNPGMLTAANAALLNQAMLANTRSLPPDLTTTGVNDKYQVKLQSPLINPTPFLSPSITQQAKVSGVSQGNVPSPSHVAPITPGHSFISPGLTLQPALTQVLFTQPPIAAYTVANSSHALVNQSIHPTVIRNPLVPTAGIPQNIATVGVAGSSVPQTTVGVTLPPVVTIGAVAYPMLNTNRAVVTAPTYTTLSFGPFPPYRFPFTNQVPLISPVALTSSNSGVPVTSVANQTVSNGRTSNGVIVHALSVPTTTPVSNAWLNSPTISNGMPTIKGLPFPIKTSVVTSSTSAVAIATTPSAVTQPANSTTQDTGVTNTQVAATTT